MSYYPWWAKYVCRLLGHRMVSMRGELTPTGESRLVTICGRCGAQLYDGPGPPYHPNCRCTVTPAPVFREYPRYEAAKHGITGEEGMDE